MARRFEVGDKVRVARLTPKSVAAKSGYFGREGFVRKIRTAWFAPWVYAVEFDEDTNFGWSDEELELIAPAPPAPSYAAGDKVRITSTGFAGRVFPIDYVDIYEGRARVCVKSDSGEHIGFFLDEIEPAPKRVWRTPDNVNEVGYDVIDEMADSVSKRAGAGEPIQRMGDVAVVATKERVYLYRLEAISDAE